MRGSNVLSLLILCAVSIPATKNVNGSQPILQKTIEALFSDRSNIIYPGSCKLFIASKRQAKICTREKKFFEILTNAKKQAISACEESFQYDRWNCSLVYNGKAKKRIFNKIYRETAFIHALLAASLTHAVAKACASGELKSCSCVGSFRKNTTWKVNGCGDDFKQGKRMMKNFLDFNHAGNDQIAETLKQDVMIGVDSIGEQMREVCKCHGFSGSCTTKTCWKRLGPFNSAMGLLKKHYHHAVKKKLLNYTTKRAITPQAKKKMKSDEKYLVYLQKTPNLCVWTKGRTCKNRHNCATLCCGRGYFTTKKNVTSRCKCRMVNCCFVECDTCVKEAEIFTCK